MPDEEWSPWIPHGLPFRPVPVGTLIRVRFKHPVMVYRNGRALGAVTSWEFVVKPGSTEPESDWDVVAEYQFLRPRARTSSRQYEKELEDA